MRVLAVTLVLFLGSVSSLHSGYAFEVSWNDNSNDEEGFTVEYKPDNGGWRKVKQVGRDVTTAMVVIDTPTTNNCFRVRGYISNVTGGSSERACKRI
jgi:hypothetical protein